MPALRFGRPEKELSKMPSWRAPSGSILTPARESQLPPMLTDMTLRSRLLLSVMLSAYLLLCLSTVVLGFIAIGPWSKRSHLMSGADTPKVSRHLRSSMD